MDYETKERLKLGMISFTLGMTVSMLFLLISLNTPFFIPASKVAETECGEYNSVTGKFQFITKD